MPDPTKQWTTRAIEVVAPGLVSAVVAGLCAGLAEGVLHGSDPTIAIAAAGFTLPYAVAAGTAASLVVTLLWRGWGLRDVVDRHVEPSGGIPAIAAWCVFLVVALLVLGATALNASLYSARAFHKAAPTALAVAIAVTAMAGVLIVVSRPVVRGIAWLLRRLDARVTRNGRRSILRPRVFAVIAAVAIAGVVVATWLISISPRIGYLDLGGPLVYAGVFAGVLIAVHLARPLVARRRRVAVAIAGGALAVVAIAMAVVIRHARPFDLLDLWGNAPATGLAIQTTYDLEAIRADFDLGAIAPSPRPGAPHHNVVLITIDTVRADHTPVYGGPTAMPGIARAGADGAVFEWAFSPSNSTRRSLPPMALGVDPRRVRGRVAGWALRLDPRHVPVAERLRAGGYDTAGFFCCGSQFGPEHRLGLNRGIAHQIIEYDGTKLIPLAREWLDARVRTGNRTPFFLWIHVIEPHRWDQIYPPERFGTAIKPRYDRVLEDTDRFLAPLLDHLRSDAVRTTTYTIVTSDHGEGLDDDGSPAHSTLLSNAQTRVPLIVTGPDVVNRRVGMPVSLTGLAPTILELAGFEPPGMPTMDGASFARLIRGEAGNPDAAEVHTAQIVDRSVPNGIRAVIRGRYKLILQDRRAPALYDIFSDPMERSDLAVRRPDLVQKLRLLLDARSKVDAIPPF